MSTDKYWMDTGILHNVSEEEMQHAVSLMIQNCKGKLDWVLDVGCGTGCSTYHLARLLNSKVIGIDTSEIAIDLARSNFGQADAPHMVYRYGVENFFYWFRPVDAVFGMGISWGMLKGFKEHALKIAPVFVVLQIADWEKIPTSRIWKWNDEESQSRTPFNSIKRILDETGAQWEIKDEDKIYAVWKR